MPSVKRTIWDFWAPRYERLWVQRSSLGPSRRLVVRHLEQCGVAPRRLLDVGCGVGQLVSELARRWPDARVIGTDTSTEMIERARGEYANVNIEYHATSLEAYRPADPFDVIVSTHAFPYMRDQPGAIRTMAGLLAPGGRLLVLCANTEGVYDRACLLFVKLTTTRATYPSAAAIQAMMADAGLRPGAIRPIEKAPYMPSIQLVEGIR